jgi:macrolide transport system ATP-binding/permease protein
VRTWDPVVLLTTTVILAIAALLAAVIPAQRAASVEPMTALRIE